MAVVYFLCTLPVLSAGSVEFFYTLREGETEMEWNEKNNPRFVIVYREESYKNRTLFRMVVDKETGVNYLLTSSGITPLLDKDGKPVVTPM